MKRRLALSLLTAATLALALAAGPARAGSDTNTLTVQANVLGTCTIDPATLDFGDYDPAAVKDVSANITVNCTYGTSHWIGLDLGTNGDRTMAGGTSEFLTYELYRDALRTETWDDADPGVTSPAGTPGLAAYTATVYGRIPANQLVSTGAYADSVTMTVNF